MEGNFGSPGQCGFSNRIFVAIDHVQYDKIYSAALAAFAGGHQVRGYIHTCEVVHWIDGFGLMPVQGFYQLAFSY
ncbi:Uncharacterised protein [BD1-7 clade bacterium]|uniref:Uncharacterized protein n=1 Tax=BD1-7 clade bacterium TaxID=2029982 RepID=A0A5S9Q4U0_9GAMM|nr:Uncharacterised protein [BD1-7 clade bacterium]CAA0111990.1 Uncharacterised protein [BD1-7 clade bacterium]